MERIDHFVEKDQLSIEYTTQEGVYSVVGQTEEGSLQWSGSVMNMDQMCADVEPSGNMEGFLENAKALIMNIESGEADWEYSAED